MSAEIIACPQARAKTVRPVFPSITGSMTIKSMDDLPLSGGACDLIMGCADTAPSEMLPADHDGAA
ncbi:hypothetical protein ABIF26_006434 [Bradyrhizobium elkanii]|uniref:hypothetical protein n=1 Tax=Bradyrhizobium elkanii TaxID=29448 RepID=UPI003515BB12